MKHIKVSVPGRICLFGEHQDYLGLPVITSAIDLHVSIEGRGVNSVCVDIDLPDIHSNEKFELNKQGMALPYIKDRDYFRSVINILGRHEISLKNGCNCGVRGRIPINSGTSSSSALTVAWVRFLMELTSDVREEFKDPMYVAHLAHQAEVKEFGEPGGMMDHYATAVGGLLYITFNKKTKVEPLKTKTGAFVLGDSGQPKDTKYVLNHVKKNVLSAIAKIKTNDRDFDLDKARQQQAEEYKALLTEDEFNVFQGALLNKEITQTAKTLLEHNFDEQQFGVLLTEHQRVLDKKLNISTPKINRMLEAALEAGAYGGKINGSGGGGCMFVYAPENTDKVAKAIEESGGKAYIVNVDEGLTVEIQ